MFTLKQEIDNKINFLYNPTGNTNLFPFFFLERANPIVPIVVIQFTQKTISTDMIVFSRFMSPTKTQKRCSKVQYKHNTVHLLDRKEKDKKNPK
jgi:hypothetical protein